MKLFYIIIFPLFFLSCQQGNRPDFLDSKNAKKISSPQVSASEEELAAASSGGYQNYENVLIGSYAKDEKAFKKIIEIRSNDACRWDGGASDIFIFHFHEIIKIFGDESAAKIIEREVSSAKKNLWLDVIFPYGQNGLRIMEYVNEFPLVYQVLSNK